MQFSFFRLFLFRIFLFPSLLYIRSEAVNQFVDCGYFKMKNIVLNETIYQSFDKIRFFNLRGISVTIEQPLFIKCDTLTTIILINSKLDLYDETGKIIGENECTIDNFKNKKI